MAIDNNGKSYAIIAVDEEGHRYDITNNLYWFEEQGYRALDDDNPWSIKYRFEIWVNGEIVLEVG